MFYFHVNFQPIFMLWIFPDPTLPHISPSYNLCHCTCDSLVYNKCFPLNELSHLTKNWLPIGQTGVQTAGWLFIAPWATLAHLPPSFLLSPMASYLLILSVTSFYSCHPWNNELNNGQGLKSDCPQHQKSEHIKGIHNSRFRMPDTIVPIVRRPVRRVSTTPATEPKVSELSSAARWTTYF